MREEVSMEGMWPRMCNLTEKSALAKGQTDGPGISLVSRQPCSRIHGEFSSMSVLERRVFITQKTRVLPLPRTQGSRLRSSPGLVTLSPLCSAQLQGCPLCSPLDALAHLSPPDSSTCTGQRTRPRGSLASQNASSHPLQERHICHQGLRLMST